jgi:hypothetical protein
LDGVITWGNGLDIPVKLGELGNSLEPIEDDDIEADQENTTGRND